MFKLQSNLFDLGLQTKKKKEKPFVVLKKVGIFLLFFFSFYFYDSYKEYQIGPEERILHDGMLAWTLEGSVLGLYFTTDFPCGGSGICKAFCEISDTSSRNIFLSQVFHRHFN